MTPQLNLQVTPYRLPEIPAGAKLVLLPDNGRDGHVNSEPCPNCSGKGTLAIKGDTCRKCGGSGVGRFIPALRWDINERDLGSVTELLKRLPPGTRRQTTVRLEETGGGLTNTGHATIVAGLHGEKLPAVYGVPKCGAAHAVFYVHAAMVVHYSQHRDRGSGYVELITISDNHRIERTELWRFTDDDIVVEVVNRDTPLDFPVAAVDAARSKARVYHCRSALYAAEKGARGPSGALTGAGAAFGGLPSPLKGPGIGYEPS